MNHEQIQHRLRAVANMRADDGLSLAGEAADCIARLAAREIELTLATNCNFLITHKQNELIKELASALEQVATGIIIGGRSADHLIMCRQVARDALQKYRGDV